MSDRPNRQVMSDWQPGDRVRLTPTGMAQDWVTATVTGVDNTKPVPGVHVRLDRPVRGVLTAFASPRELERVESSGIYGSIGHTGRTNDGSLVDPDCKAGKHGSCVHGPCMCECHRQQIEQPSIPGVLR